MTEKSQEKRGTLGFATWLWELVASRCTSGGKAKAAATSPVRIGPFRVVSSLRKSSSSGESTRGVYLAQSEDVPRLVLVKALDWQLAAAIHHERFEREIRILSQLSNPHTIRLLQAGRDRRYRYLCLEAIASGLRLDEFIQRCGGCIGDGRAIELLLQLCSALAEVHALGLIHRDIAPGNVMVSSRGGIADWLTLLDFGLAQPAEAAVDSGPVDVGAQTAEVDVVDIQSGDRPWSPPTSIAGTPAYLAPEVALLERLDARADIYATGCLAYLLLAGRPPFDSPNPVELCWRHAHHAPPPLDSVATQPLPAELSQLVMSCLEKEPSARPQSVRQLRQALQQIQPLHPWSPTEAEQWWKSQELS